MRYIPVLPEEREDMLKKIGVKDIGELFSTVPEDIRLKGKTDLPKKFSELEILRYFEELSSKNAKPANGRKWSSFLGGGAYDHFIPSALNHLVSRSEFYTAYTPYQPELSQGTLQTIFEYQSLMSSITGMEVSNASMYDGASAMAEAVLMAERINKQGNVLVASSVHPEYREVLKTYIKAKQIKVTEVPFKNSGFADFSALSSDEPVSSVVVQYPNFFGVIEDLAQARKFCDSKKALLIVVSTEPTSLGILKAPRDFGCDIFVADGQSFGNPASFGGPHLGIMTTKKEYIRNMPGRIVSRTIDSEGKPGYVLYLSTREQHIRREKATSNICTNNALCALRALVFLSLLGNSGFKGLAAKNLGNASYLKEKLAGVRGVRIQFDGPTFNEFVFSTTQPASAILKRLEEDGIVGGISLGRYFKEYLTSILVCATEMKTKRELDAYADIVKKCI